MFFINRNVLSFLQVDWKPFSVSKTVSDYGDAGIVYQTIKGVSPQLSQQLIGLPWACLALTSQEDHVRAVQRTQLFGLMNLDLLLEHSPQSYHHQQHLLLLTKGKVFECRH